MSFKSGRVLKMFLKVHKTFKRATDMNFKIILGVWPLISDFCRLLITLANSLDPDQYRQKVHPDLYINSLTLEIFFEKFNLEKSQTTTTKA